jgi:TP901 family phage tail tape measure protein
MMMLGVTISLVDRFSGGLGGVLAKIDGLRDKMANVSRVLTAGGAFVTGFGLSSKSAITEVASSFSALEDASNALKMAMLDKNGVAEGFDAVNASAIALGDRLPGTTADFLAAARALKEQGVATQSVLGGGLEAASNLAVVMKMPAEAAAEMTAKLREAYRLADEELPGMADAMQRAKFAFGMKPGDLMAASAYQAPMLNQLNITGLENTKKMLAIQGLGARVGLEGSSFGANFSMMLSRLAKGPEMVDMANKGMKSVAGDILESLGMSFDFFDEKGVYKGLDAMVSELEKLKTIKDKLGDKAAMTVADALFGAESARPAMIIAEQGMKGFQAALKDMADQASLAQRVESMLGTLANVWEAAESMFTNLKAALGAAIGDDLKALAEGFGGLSEKIKTLVTAFPGAAKWIGRVVLALTGLALIVGPILLALGALGGLVLGMTAGWAVLAPVIAVAGAAFMGLVAVVKAASLALLTNPITLTLVAIVAAIMALAYAAKLIYDNWEPILAWFSEAWAAAVAHFTGEAEKVRAAWNALVGWIGEKIQALGNWLPDFSGLIPDAEKIKAGWDALLAWLEKKLQALGNLMPDFSGMIPDWMKGSPGEAVKNRMPDFSGLIPDWMKGSPGEAVKNRMPDFSGMIPDGIKHAPDVHMGESRPRIDGGAGVPVSGKISIDVNQEGRVTSVHALSDNPNVPMFVDTGGYYMAMNN